MFLIITLLGCPLLPSSSSIGGGSEAQIIEMCREDSIVSLAKAKELTAAGWTYQGPVYNNGINCTDGLWTR